MSLTKVLSLIGDENISYQNIESSALKMRVNKKHKDCEITIATEFDMLNGCHYQIHLATFKNHLYQSPPCAGFLL